MYKSLYDKFKNWYKTDGVHENAIWLFSDPHFNDPEANFLRKDYIGDEEQLKRLNSKIGKHDTVICLGDVGDLNFIKRLKGYKVLIMGNHDKGASNYQRVIKSERKLFVMPHNKELPYTPEQYDQNEDIRNKVMEDYPGCDYIEIKAVKNDNHLFDEVYEGPLMISDKIVLSHEPLGWDYVLNIHGHDHSSWYVSDKPHINLCVELINYTVVSLKSIIESGILKTLDDIHRVTIDSATKKKADRKKTNN
jgi:calcineurin-like phosphoesterase family protein